MRVSVRQRPSLAIIMRAASPLAQQPRMQACRKAAARFSTSAPKKAQNQVFDPYVSTPRPHIVLSCPAQVLLVPLDGIASCLTPLNLSRIANTLAKVSATQTGWTRI